jgi:hypothetical protein
METATISNAVLTRTRSGYCLVLVFVIVLLLVGCQLQTPRPAIAASEMLWNTQGGGQATFSIAKRGVDYDVHATAFQFEPVDERFTVTTESGEVYTAISNVMQDQSAIELMNSDAPTGSWTTLQFSHGERSTTLKDVIVDGDLRTTYNYVVAQIVSTMN